MIAWYAYAMLALMQQPSQPAAKPNLNQAQPPLPQAMPSIAPAPASTADEKPPIAPWQGTLRAGQAKLQELSLAQKYDEALELGQRLLAMPSWSELPERERAEALYALGVARGTAEQVDAASEAFHRASGLAGSDPLGLDSIYGAGTFRLLKAEDLRKNIPEIREKLGLQPLPPAQTPPVQLGAPPGPGTGGPPGPGTSAPSAAQPEPDALSIAKEAYLAARRDLVDRLRCDTSDRDTRGNLELTQRRLRELDALEKKRKDDEQKQQDQQKQDKDPKQNDKQKKDQQKQDPAQQDKQDEQKNDQQKQDDQQPPQDQQKPEDQPKPDEQKKDEQKSDTKEEKPKDAQPDPKSAQQEQVLSDEEVMRLLDQLRQIEQQAEQVRAALRERHRVPVKKDW